VERLCDRALWLKRGRIVAYGEPTVVAGQYAMEMRSQSQQRTPHRPPQLTRLGTELRVNENRFGSQEIEITDVRLQPNNILETGDALCIEIDYQSQQLIDTAIFGVTVSREDGTTCLDVNTSDMRIPVPRISGKNTIRLWCDRLDLCSGKYFVNVGVFKEDWAYAYDYHWHVYPLVVESEVPAKGILTPPMRWEMVSQVVAS
jgi:lipopolysaccharide transport system ATP-binding protein